MSLREETRPAAELPRFASDYFGDDADTDVLDLRSSRRNRRPAVAAAVACVVGLGSIVAGAVLSGHPSGRQQETVVTCPAEPCAEVEGQALTDVRVEHLTAVALSQAPSEVPSES